MKEFTIEINSYAFEYLDIKEEVEVVENNYKVILPNDIPLNKTIIKRHLRSDHFIITLIKAGQIHLQMDLNDYFSSTNRLIVLPCNIIDQFRTFSDKKPHGINFSLGLFQCSMAYPTQADSENFCSGKTTLFLDLKEKEFEILERYILFLIEKDLNTEVYPFRNDIIYHIFNGFMFEIAAIFEKYLPGGNNSPKRKEELLDGFLKSLSHSFRKERTVQFYADELYISPKHLNKTVKELTSKTCSEIIHEMVIKEANLLLNQLRLSIADVAKQLNFSDQFFFSKFFKKYTGINPREYRNRISTFN